MNTFVYVHTFIFIKRRRFKQSYLTWVVTRVTLAHPLEDMVQSKYVAHLVDHGVVVALGAKVGRVKNHPTWGQKKKSTLWVTTSLLLKQVQI